jgi:hypothetical protein
MTLALLVLLALFLVLVSCLFEKWSQKRQPIERDSVPNESVSKWWDVPVQEVEAPVDKLA